MVDVIDWRMLARVVVKDVSDLSETVPAFSPIDKSVG